IAAGAGAAPTSTTLQTDTPGFSLEVSNGRITERIDVDHESVSFDDSADDDSEDGRTSTEAPTVVSRSGQPHHLDLASRQEMFDLISEARRSARVTDAQSRSAKARELLAEARSRGLGSDIDPGATAAASDLRQTVRGRLDPKKIQPHRTAL